MKIEIIQPSASLVGRIKSLVDKILTETPGLYGDPQQYDSYWAFSLSLGNNRSTPVAFLGKNDRHYGDKIDNLSLGKAIDKRGLFEKAWNELNKAPL